MITKQELLDYTKSKKGMDERESMLDQEHDSSALTATITFSYVMALFKTFVLKKNPCDILAIQSFALAAKKTKDWKESKRRTDALLAGILFLDCIGNMTYYLTKKELK